jgi:hypothetical protein
MRKFLAAFAVAAPALVQPAPAITFPQLTTIYVGAGVLDDGGSSEAGTATSFFCSNVSGQTATVRVAVLNFGSILGTGVTVTLVHTQSRVFSTHNTVLPEAILSTGAVAEGVVNIESTQSGVFCRGAVVNAAGPRHDSSPVDLVRINPHPGSVE